jgi:hypothetical protein
MKLRIEIGQCGALVFGRVQSRPENLNKDWAIGSARIDFFMRSSQFPALGEFEFCIGGLNPEWDHQEFFYQYNDAAQAALAIEVITDLVKEVNRGIPETFTKEVKLRVIE